MFAGAGEILATFGVECSTGHTFTDGKVNYGMNPMYVPDPVISYAIKPLDKNKLANFGKALNRFTKEDPTFRSHVDPESSETIIEGMGELHLEIYIERMKREYGVEVKAGEPRVNFRETISQKAEFNYLHKKQSGGSGQFGRIIGYLEPLEDPSAPFEFVNAGASYPPSRRACPAPLPCPSLAGLTGNPRLFPHILTSASHTCSRWQQHHS